MSKDTGPAKLPSLPMVPTGNLALDSLLRAIIERLEVREGTRGNPAERVVLQRDLTSIGLPTYRSGAFPGSSETGILVRSPSGSYATVSIDQFAEDIRGTKLYQNLLTKLNDPARFNSLPEKVRELLAPEIALEAVKRQADVQRVDEKYQDLTTSLAYSLQEVTASVASAAAGVRELSFASATAEEAIAGRVTTVEARLDDVGGVTLEQSLIATASRLTGLAGEYMVKINAGNAVAGFGLAASEDPLGNTQSAFIIQADKFAVMAAANFVQETAPSATSIGQIWYTPSTKVYQRATATGAASWAVFTPGVPFGVDTANNTIYLNGQVQINSGGVSLADAASAAGVSIAASSLQWRVDSLGATVNPSITLVAQLRSPLTGFVTWSASGSSTTPPLAGSSNTWVVYDAAQVADSATYTATLVVGGITYSNTVTLTRLRDGLEGAVGQAGPMGSLTGYGEQYGITSTSWSDTIASRVIFNMITGGTGTSALAATDHLALGDTVTLSNGTTFAQTKYWSGTSWLTPGVVIDGNLLVNGTVSATKITAGSISSSGGNASISIGSTSFIGTITSPLHVSKTAANEQQALITAANNKDTSVAIWGSSTFAGGNAVSGTWHSSDAETAAGRWQLLGVLGSSFLGAAVAGDTYGGTVPAGAFRRYSGSSNLVPGSVTNQTRLAGATWAVEATGPVRLESTTSPLIVNGAAGTSGQVLTSGGAGVTPSWTTVSGGGGALTYSELQGVTSGTTGSALRLTATMQVTGLTLPTSGAGVEIAYQTGTGYVNSYDRDTTVYKPLSIGGSTVSFPNSTAISMAVAPTFPTPATATNSTVAATTAYVKAQGYTANAGTVTSFSFTNGNGITGTVATSTSTPTLSFSLGAVTGTSFNGVTGLSAVVGTALGTAAVGTATTAAKADHVHPLQTTMNGKKIDGGSGAGGVAVTFATTFAAAPGISVVPIDGYVAGITAITATGFTAVTRTIAGAVSSQAFRWVAIGA